ncbi:hypothetical protein O0L34_g19103 [Tuta absoluta]|nr:hypothetical protein O0L34_g19103 [Tuta absoluta]
MQKTRKYPPIVVERLPNWTRHLSAIKELLGYTPNARAFGEGVRFTPRTDEEFRTTQRYFINAKKEEANRDMQFYCFTPAAELPTKVALRGIPRDTPMEEIQAELAKMGLTLRHGRSVAAKRGRPGCLFFLELDPTPKEDLEELFRTTEFLCLPGVTFEAWRPRPGPAQCHRCQGFGHSSANCYRLQRCVRCAGDHAAADCDRAREAPPTCANCKGAHPANDRRCPVLRREARARDQRIPPPLPNQPNAQGTRPGLRHEAPVFVPRVNRIDDQRPPTTLAPEANQPPQRGATGKSRRRRRRPRGGRRRHQPQEEETARDLPPRLPEDFVPPPPATADFADDEVVLMRTEAPPQLPGGHLVPPQPAPRRQEHRPAPPRSRPQMSETRNAPPAPQKKPGLAKTQAAELLTLFGRTIFELAEAIESGSGNLHHIMAVGLKNIVDVVQDLE